MTRTEGRINYYMSNEKKVHELTKKIEVAKLKKQLEKLRVELKALKTAKAPKIDIQEKELEIEQTIAEIAKTRSLKLKPEESKKNKKKMGKLKKAVVIMVIGGITVAVVVAAFQPRDLKISPKDLFGPDSRYTQQTDQAPIYEAPENYEDEDDQQMESHVTYNSPYNLCITYNHPELSTPLYHMNDDLAYFHILREGDTNRLVVVSLNDNTVRDVFTREVINGVTIGSRNLVPLANAGLMGDIVENGNTVQNNNNYTVTIDRDDLGGLLQGPNATRITYNDTDELNELLDGAVQTGRSK